MHQKPLENRHLENLEGGWIILKRIVRKLVLSKEDDETSSLSCPMASSVIRAVEPSVSVNFTGLKIA